MSLKNHLPLAQSESLLYYTGLGATFAAAFVLIYWLRDWPLSVVAYRFELKRQSNTTDAIVL